MGILLKTLFISVTLFMLFETSHEANLRSLFYKIAKKTFGLGDTNAAKYFNRYYSFLNSETDGYNPNSQDLVKYTEEINSNVVDSRLMILWSGEQKELLKRMMDDSEIHFSSYLHQPGAKFTDSLYSYKEFLDCLEKDGYSPEKTKRAVETQLSIDMVRVHKGDVCYLCDNSFGQATCGGTKTIFAKYEVPNLSDKVESMYAVVRDMKRDGTYDPSTDTTLHKLKKDLSKRGITLKVIYIEADKQHHFDIFEHIVEAIRKSWENSKLIPDHEVVTVTANEPDENYYKNVFKLG